MSAPAPAGRPPKATYDKEALAFSKATGAGTIGRALAFVENAPVLTLAVYKSMGRGSDLGWILAYCHGAEQYAKASDALVSSLFKADASFLIKLGGNDGDASKRAKAACLAIGRILDCIMETRS